MTKQDSTTGVEKEFAEATPRPWRRVATPSSSHRQSIYSEDHWICSLDASMWPGRDYTSVRTDTELIIAAVNSYDSLRSQVEALREALGTIATRYHADTCSHALVEEHACNCHVSIARAALESKQ